MDYYSYKEGHDLLLDYAKNKEVGTVLPPEGDNRKLAVYRDDSRDDMENVGFVPSRRRNAGDNAEVNARNQVTEILGRDDILDFIRAWKRPGDDDLIKGADGRMAGVCCGVSGGQKGGRTYKITVPKLYLLNKKTGKAGSVIAVYGDETTLENCKTIAMNLVVQQEASEFVFLTPVPPEWVEKAD